MNPPILILRPIEGAQKTAAKARELGLIPVVDPLFAIRPLSWSASSVDRYDAIMFTSANALKMGGPRLSQYVSLPALAVGTATKNAAEAEGFRVVQTGDSGVQSLVDMLPKGGFNRILRLSGAEYTSVKSDRIADQVIVYESAHTGLGGNARETLNSGAIVLVHSMLAAQMLVHEMEKQNIDANKNHLVAISPKVAAVAGDGWKSIHAADEPTDEALLTQAARLCSQ